MVHRALLGSLERFIGCLIEQYGGAFPVWLAPVQAVIIPIADRHNPYAASVAERLRQAGLRAQVDDSAERMNAKIRVAQLNKVPYMLVVGDREAEADSASVRLRTGDDKGTMKLDQFLETAKARVATKALEVWPAT
jgi:threonyl-tRNA synthetase